MRRPSVSAKLPILKSPGLSNYLSGQITLENLFQYCGIPGEEQAFAVIAAGRNPPNPVELLSSARMSAMLEQLRGSFHYILLDLPPVGEVSDALAVAKVTDGMLLVVRQNYGNRIAYNATVRQFEFVDARILGVVYNCATDNAGGYGKKYYKKYRNSYAGYYQKTAKLEKERQSQRSAPGAMVIDEQDN
jgi:capsular exopolysaccharide synthesis family protein